MLKYLTGMAATAVLGFAGASASAGELWSFTATSFDTDVVLDVNPFANLSSGYAAHSFTATGTIDGQAVTALDNPVFPFATSFNGFFYDEAFTTDLGGLSGVPSFGPFGSVFCTTGGDTCYTFMPNDPDAGVFQVQAWNSTHGWGPAGLSDGGFTPLGNAVPEPASWALMILGFGAAGAMLRHRRQVMA